MKGWSYGLVERVEMFCGCVGFCHMIWIIIIMNYSLKQFLLSNCRLLQSDLLFILVLEDFWLWSFGLFLLYFTHLFFSLNFGIWRQAWVSSIAIFLPLPLVSWREWTWVSLFWKSCLCIKWFISGHNGIWWHDCSNCKPSPEWLFLYFLFLYLRLG